MLYLLATSPRHVVIQICVFQSALSLDAAYDSVVLTPTTFRRSFRTSGHGCIPTWLQQLHSRVLYGPTWSSSSPGVDLLRWPRALASSAGLDCRMLAVGPEFDRSKCASMQGFRSSAACEAIVCLLYRTTFAVHSAFPAKSVSALPPGADSHSPPLVEISVPAHWPD